jgi:hypothetical protein
LARIASSVACSSGDSNSSSPMAAPCSAAVTDGERASGRVFGGWHGTGASRLADSLRRPPPHSRAGAGMKPSTHKQNRWLRLPRAAQPRIHNNREHPPAAPPRLPPPHPPPAPGPPGARLCPDPRNPAPAQSHQSSME